MTTSARDRIRTLNDLLRRYRLGGQVVLTPGVLALGLDVLMQVEEALACFDSFDSANDPHGEHDFGALEVAGERLFFKIDYYDQSLSAHSPNPADETLTKRVLTIMLAEEY